MVRRYRKRRRMKMRRRRSMRMRRYAKRRIPKFDEVKLYTLGVGNQALKVTSFVDTTAHNVTFIWNNILNRITQGTDYGNRIGTQIYVLNIKFKMNVWMCSDTQNRSMNTGILRLVVGEPTGTELTSQFGNFFRIPAMRDKTIAPLNRKYYTFHYDKTYYLNSGWPYDSGVNNAYSGAMKHIEFNIPINRRVEYTNTNVPKNQRDFISLFAFPWVPNADLIDAQKVMCSNIVATIYYVDA